ncbi:MAG: hypothetical protein HY875_13245 [Chloroflexi bacterium]|nr:hypothetical protein [Chloroflexota bacterium]
MSIRSPRGAPAVCLALAALAAVFFLACSAKDGDTPVTATPTAPVAGESALFAARLDLAGRLRIAPVDVQLRQLRGAGWDSCAGVGLPGKACRELFGAGIIASFRAEGKGYRYHIFGNDFYATDFIKGATISDGSPLPNQMRIDFGAVLAEYSRLELVQLRLSPARIVTARITNIVPAGFSSSCPGFIPRGVDACTTDLVPGDVILIAGSDGRTYRYHVGAAFGVVATDFEFGKITMEPDPRAIELQGKMRFDLARRLGLRDDEIALKSYREVTWPDGCLGVSKPGVMCTQALVPGGFLAIYTDPAGKDYRYHGLITEPRFIAASFERGATLTDPIFGD